MKNKLPLLVVAVLVVVAGVYFMNKPDDRGVGERIDDAVAEIQDGGSVNDAAQKMEDQSAGDKVGDVVDDAAAAVDDAAQAVGETVNDAVQAVEEAVTPEAAPAAPQ